MSKTKINTNKLLEMENKLHKYQEALEFYAKESNYSHQRPYGSGSREYSPVQIDGGGLELGER